MPSLAHTTTFKTEKEFLVNVMSAKQRTFTKIDKTFSQKLKKVIVVY